MDIDIPTATSSSTIFSVARKKTEEYDAQELNRPFTIVDLARVRRQLGLWKTFLPSVKPYYAVKCHSDDAIISTLLDEGCGFDCASQQEMEQVLRISKNADILLAHPIKTRQCIRFAVNNGINRMTFDSLEELVKMTETAEGLSPILRLKVHGFNALVNMNTKYGADEETSMFILKMAAEMNIPVAGLSFHIGSGVEDYRPIARVLAFAKTILDFGRNLGHPLQILDIGGGMVYSNEKEVAKLGHFIERSLDYHFKGTNVKVIAEPGRFLVNNCQYVVTKVLQVIPKTVQVDHEVEYNVFINDGVYGSFNYVMTEQREAFGIPLKERKGTTIKADIWGPTCCSFDIVEKNRKISPLREGDWLIYPNNGAYSTVLGTSFNGFSLPDKFYLGLAEESKITASTQTLRSKL